MTGLTNYTAQGLLGHITGKTAIYSLPTTYVALFTAVGTDVGTGFTEAAFTGTPGNRRWVAIGFPRRERRLPPFKTRTRSRS